MKLFIFCVFIVSENNMNIKILPIGKILSLEKILIIGKILSIGKFLLIGKILSIGKLY